MIEEVSKMKERRTVEIVAGAAESGEQAGGGQRDLEKLVNEDRRP